MSGRDIDPVLALRLTYLDHGYEPIPVLPSEKRPLLPQWPAIELSKDRIRQDRVERQDETNTGLRTGRLVAFDNDAEDPAERDAIAAIVARIAGPSPLKRVGRKGAVTLYSTDTPTRKITVARASTAKELERDGRKRRAVLEVLGQGQQFVAHGIHPDTGKPYAWEGGRSPADTPLTGLPVITPAQVRDIAREVVAHLEKRGHVDVRASGPDLHDRVSAAGLEDLLDDTDPPPPFRPPEIKARLAYLPAADLDYGEWLAIVAAVRSALPGDPEAALDAVDEWSALDVGRYDGPDEVRKYFDSMPPRPGGVTWRTLIKRTDGAGYNGPTTWGDATALREATERYIAAESAERRNASRFRLISPAEMRALPRPSYAVEGLIPEQGIVLLYGAPRALKTFLTLNILGSVAAGIPAFGRFETKQGPTILCAGEAPFSIAHQRFPAFCQESGIEDPDALPFHMVRGVPLAVDVSQVDELIEQAKAAGVRPKVVAVDTVARAMYGLNESEAKDMNALLAAAEKLRDELECAVILIHHEGKNESRGARGSSVLPAGVDAVFRVDRPTDALAVTITCEKLKDADEPAPINLRGREIRLPDGQTSLAFEVADDDEWRREVGRRVSVTRSEVGAALRAMGAVNGETCKTHPLAAQIAAQRSNAPDENTVGAIEKALQRRARGDLAAYVALLGKGGRDPTLWTLATTTP